MARRTPFTAQEERLARATRNAERKIVELRGMIDTAERIVAAQSLEIGDPDNPQVIEVSESGGGLELGGGSPIQVVDAITAEASHTGDTVETAIGELTVPANRMGPNGFVRISVECGPHLGAKTNVYWGEITAGKKIGYYNHLGGDFLIYAREMTIWNKGATNAQHAPNPNSAAALIAHYIANGVPIDQAEDTTQDVKIPITVENANAGDTSYLWRAFVEACYRD